MLIAVDARPLAVKELTGVGQYTKNLLKNIFELDSANSYFLFASGRAIYEKHIQELTARSNVVSVFLRWPNKLLNLSLAITGRPRLDKIVQKTAGRQPDLFFFPNLNFARVKCPYVAVAHDLSFELFPEFFSAKMRFWHYACRPKRFFDRADKIVAVSHNTAADLKKAFSLPLEKITTIYHGAPDTPANQSDIALTKQKFNLPDNFILHISTLEPRKNLLCLIRAFESLSKTEPTLHLVVAGTLGWKSHEVQKLLQANPKIKYLNYINEQEKLALYSLAKFFAFPSFYEGFGLPAMEAMAAGCPVITAANSSLPEIFDTAALYANAYDENSLLAAMRQMLNPEIAAEYRRRSLARVKLFNWRQTAARYLKIFNSFQK